MQLVLIIPLLFFCVSLKANQIALIIDDMGNNKQDAVAFSLPVNVAFAILPNKPLSKIYSQRATAEQRQVMLHMPMESLAGINQEKGVLLSNMQPYQIIKTLETALFSVPHAIGVNNHMGSKLTQLSLPMSVTMEFLYERGLFFVDSRTTKYSKAEIIAKKSGVLTGKRNVFLDHVIDTKLIDKEFQRLMRLSKKYGYAVGIAHPYPETLAYLKLQLSLLKETDIKLVKLTDLLSFDERFAYRKKLKSEPPLPLL